MCMHGIDQKTVVPSTVSSRYGRGAVGAVPKANEPESKLVKRAGGEGVMTPHPDPTRFGDWEKNGRCIEY